MISLQDGTLTGMSYLNAFLTMNYSLKLCESMMLYSMPWTIIIHWLLSSLTQYASWAFEWA